MSVRELRHERPSGWFSKSRRLSGSVSFLSSPPLPGLLLASFVARTLALVPRSLLQNRTETLATQAKRIFLCSKIHSSVTFKLVCAHNVRGFLVAIAKAPFDVVML